MRRSICILALLFSFQFSNAQTLKELMAADSAVWFGIDYSKARFTGSFAQAFGIDPNDGTEIVQKWIPEWNKILLKEPQNFQIGEALKKPYTYLDINSVNIVNSRINKDSVYSEVSTGYKIQNPEKVIPEMIKNYSSDRKKSGIGLAFIVESYNKEAHMAYVYFVVFRINNQQLLGYKKLSATPKGIGLRNYWSGAVKELIKSMGSAYSSIAWNATKPTK